MQSSWEVNCHVAHDCLSERTKAEEEVHVVRRRHRRQHLYRRRGASCNAPLGEAITRESAAMKAAPSSSELNATRANVYSLGFAVT